jgi:hypothetical protein
MALAIHRDSNLERLLFSLLERHTGMAADKINIRDVTVEKNFNPNLFYKFVLYYRRTSIGRFTPAYLPGQRIKYKYIGNN